MIEPTRSMTVEQTNVLKPFEAKYVKITDQKRIEEYNKLELYIPPHETLATYDSKLLKDDSYKKSKSQVGELRAIEVAVWENDPDKNSDVSHARIHLRIINGRHRYTQDPKWERVYYDFAPIEQTATHPTLAYLQARQHFDLQKEQTQDEKRMLLEETGEAILHTTTIPMKKICAKLVELFVPQGLMGESTIIHLCPSKYKDELRAQSKKGHTFEEANRDTKKKLEVKNLAKDITTKLEAEKNRLITDLTKMESEKIGVEKELKKQLEVTDELQSKLRIITNTDHEVDCNKCGNKIPVTIDVTGNKVLVKK